MITIPFTLLPTCSPLMVLVQKVTLVAFALHDGTSQNLKWYRIALLYDHKICLGTSLSKTQPRSQAFTQPGNKQASTQPTLFPGLHPAWEQAGLHPAWEQAGLHPANLVPKPPLGLDKLCFFAYYSIPLFSEFSPIMLSSCPIISNIILNIFIIFTLQRSLYCNMQDTEM